MEHWTPQAKLFGDGVADSEPGFCGVLANAHELGCSQVANEGTITIAIKRGCVT